MNGEKNFDFKINESIGVLRAMRLLEPKNIAVSFSHQSEDAVVIDLLKRAKMEFSVFTLDTFKLFEESRAYERVIEEFFGLQIQKYSAPAALIESLESAIGENGIYESVESRKECCRVRKLLPLKEALEGKDGWVTGVRREQSLTRSDFEFIEIDKESGTLKASPILNWSKEDVGLYMSLHAIPINKLYKNSFASIGCEPCTRAIREGEHERAGRWWWEEPDHKECGLHRRR